jgi:hypothetical protein
VTDNPQHPKQPPVSPPSSSRTGTDELNPQTIQSAEEAITLLRQKMEVIATEFAEGRINRSQFNAVYGRYSEQRSIIERIIERNPDSRAWKQVIGTSGHTNFLRQRFEAQPLYVLVYKHRVPSPLMAAGKTTPDMQAIAPILKGLWSMPNRPKTGLARKIIGEHQWLVLAMGENALTIVVFLLEPSVAQAAMIRDLHADFERANQAALNRQVHNSEHMVFPQRALVETDLA